MATLTSIYCVSCAHLAAKIAELEERISTLYKIREAEQLMDTIIFGPLHPDTNATSASDPIGSAPIL